MSSSKGKNKYIAAFLAYMLGGFGAHRFYLGQYGLGLIYLLFSWTLIPAVAAFFEVFYFIFFISDEEFDRRYNLHRMLPEAQPQKILPSGYTSDGYSSSLNGVDGSLGNSDQHVAYQSDSMQNSQPQSRMARVKADLQDLDDMYRQGMISDYEYAEQRKRILS